MSTGQTLRDRALKQVGCLGQTEAEDFAELALEECMKFVAFNVRVPSLIGSAQATAPADPDLEASAIPIGLTGFAVSATFKAPDSLWVKKDSSAVNYGTPYDFLEYDHFLALGAIPTQIREGFDALVASERPKHCWTITPSDKVWATPLTEGNVLTLFFRKEPAAYGDAVTPEIHALFDYILVNGAVLALKEWLREPDGVVNMWQIFRDGLAQDIADYKSHLNGRRKRSNIRIHRSYRPC
jgi:hypothetical protein